MVRGDRAVDLGKYGRIRSEELVGCRLNMCYDVSRDGALSPFLPFDQEQAEDGALSAIVHPDAQLTNREICDLNTSQRLSHAEILELRDSGGAVITELIQNSATFEQKNSFSKVKYIERKRKKFSRWIRLLPTSTRTLCQHFTSEEPHKIL